MSDSKKLKLSGDSRFLQKVALKKDYTSLQQEQKHTGKLSCLITEKDQRWKKVTDRRITFVP